MGEQRPARSDGASRQRNIDFLHKWGGDAAPSGKINGLDDSLLALMVRSIKKVTGAVNEATAEAAAATAAQRVRRQASRADAAEKSVCQLQLQIHLYRARAVANQAAYEKKKALWTRARSVMRAAKERRTMAPRSLFATGSDDAGGGDALSVCKPCSAGGSGDAAANSRGGASTTAGASDGSSDNLDGGGGLDNSSDRQASADHPADSDDLQPMSKQAVHHHVQAMVNELRFGGRSSERDAEDILQAFLNNNEMSELMERLMNRGGGDLNKGSTSARLASDMAILDRLVQSVSILKHSTSGSHYMHTYQAILTAFSPEDDQSFDFAATLNRLGLSSKKALEAASERRRAIFCEDDEGAASDGDDDNGDGNGEASIWCVCEGGTTSFGHTQIESRADCRLGCAQVPRNESDLSERVCGTACEPNFQNYRVLEKQYASLAECERYEVSALQDARSPPLGVRLLPCF